MHLFALYMLFTEQNEGLEPAPGVGKIPGFGGSLGRLGGQAEEEPKH